jgi:hypothetical protein
VTSRLGTGKPRTFFYSVGCSGSDWHTVDEDLDLHETKNFHFLPLR